MALKWRRRERGSYVTEINGEQVSIVNMKGDGPNAPKWQGPVPAWEIRSGGRGEYDIGCKVLGHEHTLADAKSWVEGSLR